jgi:hypothetical protein
VPGNATVPVAKSVITIPVLIVNVRAVLPLPLVVMERLEGRVVAPDDVPPKVKLPTVRFALIEIVELTVAFPVAVAINKSSPEAGEVSPAQLAAVAMEVPAPFVPPSQVAVPAMAEELKNERAKTTGAGALIICIKRRVEAEVK